jgi:GNAT superfamily N-acetyltransferase
MTDLTIRPIAPADRAAWTPLWDGYNAFYGRAGETALAPQITQVLWQRLLDAAEPVHALVAEDAGGLLGIVHFLFHRSTTRIEPVCYLQDLFTVPEARGRGVGRALIEGVYVRASEAGAKRVYWQTKQDNATARRLYDQVARHHGFVVYAHDA